MNRIIHVLRIGSNPSLETLEVREGKSYLMPSHDPEQAQRFQSLMLGRKQIQLPTALGYQRYLSTFYGYDRERLLRGAQEALGRNVENLTRMLGDAQLDAGALDSFIGSLRAE